MAFFRMLFGAFLDDEEELEEDEDFFFRLVDEDEVKVSASDAAVVERREEEPLAEVLEPVIKSDIFPLCRMRNYTFETRCMNELETDGASWK